jgi:hypothetical protein
MMGTPDFIGGSKETIGSLLAQRTSGCQRVLICLRYCLIRTLSVITLELSKFDSHGNQRKIRTSIQFTITVGLEPEAAAANSSSFQQIRKVIDASDTVKRSTQPDRWGPLLYKIKILMTICDGVSEVGHIPELFSV